MAFSRHISLAGLPTACFSDTRVCLRAACVFSEGQAERRLPPRLIHAAACVTRLLSTGVQPVPDTYNQQINMARLYVSICLIIHPVSICFPVFTL